jgi:hypothetical protein
MMSLNIEAFEFIGHNCRWCFAIAKNGDRWLGVAIEGWELTMVMEARASEGLTIKSLWMHIFPHVSDGSQLGMKDKKIAILLTGALAQEDEQGFGGIDEWLVPEDMRGDPDKFRCKQCGTVGCEDRDRPNCCGVDEYFEEEGY